MCTMIRLLFEFVGISLDGNCQEIENLLFVKYSVYLKLRKYCNNIAMYIVIFESSDGHFLFGFDIRYLCGSFVKSINCMEKKYRN